MTRDEIIKLAASMGALWPNWRAPVTRADLETTVAVWTPLLEDLDAAAVLSVLRRYAASGAEFAPPVGRLRADVVALADQEAPDADQAWGEVLGALQSIGWNGAPVWSHPAVEDTVRAMGGWMHLCETATVKSEVADRAHFTRFYATAVRRHRRDATPPGDAAVLDRWRLALGQITKPELT